MTMLFFEFDKVICYTCLCTVHNVQHENAANKLLHIIAFSLQILNELHIKELRSDQFPNDQK